MKIDIVAKAIVMDDKGNCLLLRRGPTHPDMAGQPDLPGGLVDPGESVDQAVKREIIEETGLQTAPTAHDMLYADTSAYKDRSVTRCLFVVRVAGERPAVTLSWEHDGQEWVPFTALADRVTHPIYHAGIQYIQTNELITDK